MSRKRSFAGRGRRSGWLRGWFGRVMDLLLAVAILGLLALVVAHWNDDGTGTIEGRAVVLDGDTLVIREERIRLRGIDAPELDQTCRRRGEPYACGREARAELIRLVGGTAVTCDTHGRDRYGRMLGVCSAAGVGLNAEMVERGWAVDYGGHADAEEQARTAGAGLWAGEFERPEEWRRAHGDLERPEGGLWHWLRTLLGV